MSPYDQDNQLRFDPGGGGHVESYFMRANHPSKRQAFWLKATVLAPIGGSPVAEAWCAIFDGDRGRTFATKVTVPFSEARFSGSPMHIDVAGCRFHLGSEGGESRGRIDNARGRCSWDLKWQRPNVMMADPLCMLPSRRLIDGRFPRSKPLPPAPLLRFDGTVTLGDESVPVEGWLGMQGHNWGKEHAYRYAWGQCLFTDAEDEPVCMVEAASGRLKLGPLVTPYLSTMVVRRGERSYRFDRFWNVWQNRAHVDGMTWTLRAKGAGGEAVLRISARPEEMACLGYRNPDGSLSYCLNSKLSEAVLRVVPVNEPRFECSSEHGAALELLQREPDPRVPDVV